MITNGTVTIEDGVKAKEEYAPARKVAVSISFSVPEGGDGQAYLDEAGAIASAKVDELLGRDAGTASKPKVNKPQGKKAAVATGIKVAAGDASKKAYAEKVAKETPTGVEVEPDTEDQSDLEDFLIETAPAPITDDELGKAVRDKAQALQAKIGDAANVKIRELVAEYNDKVVGKKMADIPAAKRHDFLEKLKTLN